jgi:putative ATP-binding cassette transporter
MDRLIGFNKNIEEAENFPILNFKSGDIPIKVSNLSLYLPNGHMLINDINFELHRGDRLLIKGYSGSGKTTLLRTLAGIWPFVSGEVEQQQGIYSLFMSQKPYMPIGRLYDSICYPLLHRLPKKTEMLVILNDCGLKYLSEKLDDFGNWSSILSIGEQQKVAFCRLLLNKPDVVYLDESSSALDEDSENMLYNLIINKLPNTIIVSVAHRSSVNKWHNKIINLDKKK